MAHDEAKAKKDIYDFFQKVCSPCCRLEKNTEASTTVPPDYRAASGYETPELILILHHSKTKRKVRP